jgi:hypothetical protein
LATALGIAAVKGSDSRFIVTNLTGTPRWLYEVLYCGRGQAESLIKAHKLHLASDRTSCTKATANQFRLLAHTAAYWLLHTLKSLARFAGRGPRLAAVTAGQRARNEPQPTANAYIEDRKRAPSATLTHAANSPS